MTWSFLFLACLLVGMVMAVTAGLLSRMTVHKLCHDITVPAPEHRTALINTIAHRTSVPVTAFGLVGLLLRHSEVSTRFIWAGVVAGVCGVAAIVALREWKTAPPLAHAVVVREIPPNGFGQVQVEQSGRTFLLAAKSADGRRIASGSPVEMVDCESSVLTVKATGGVAPAA